MKKIPFVTKEKVDEIVRQYPTPFHIYDEKGIRENVKALKEAFSWNKGFKEYFAVKATPNPYLIDILREYGCGCDCSSLTELMLSKAMGVKGEDIMFSSNATPAKEFAYANEIGAIINLDDITHIDFLEKTIGKLPETLSCRFNPGGLFKISNSIMDNPGDAKYGFTTEQMYEGFKILKEKGVKNFGIHAFLASNTVTNDYYPTLAKTLFELAVDLKAKTGADIKFINLSGGIGIPYRPEQEPNDIYAIGEGVRKVYEEVLVPAGMGDVAIYTELGRFMMGPYGQLVTTAVHEKHQADGSFVKNAVQLCIVVYIDTADGKGQQRRNNEKQQDETGNTCRFRKVHRITYLREITLTFLLYTQKPFPSSGFWLFQNIYGTFFHGNGGNLAFSTVFSVQRPAHRLRGKDPTALHLADADGGIVDTACQQLGGDPARFDEILGEADEQQLEFAVVEVHRFVAQLHRAGHDGGVTHSAEDVLSLNGLTVGGDGDVQRADGGQGGDGVDQIRRMSQQVLHGLAGVV